MSLQVETFLIFVGISGIISIGLMIFIARYRMYAPGAKFILLALFASLMWHVGSFIEISGVSVETKILGLKIKYLLGIPYVPVFFALGVMRFVSFNKLPRRGHTLFALLIPFLVSFLAVTSDYHSLFFAHLELYQYQNFTLLRKYQGPVFPVHMVYSYSVSLGLYLMIIIHLKNEKLLQGIIPYMFIAGLLSPWAANIMYMYNVFGPMILDYTNITMAFGALILVLGMYKFGLFLLVPVARDKIIDTIDEGVIVVSKTGKVIDCNAPMEKLFHTHWELGERVDEVFCRNNFPLEILQSDLPLEFDDRGKVLQVTATELTGITQLKGRVYTFSDITDLKAKELHLKQIAKQKDKFFSIIAHDLKNPFFAISGFADILYTEYGDLNENEKLELIRKIRAVTGDTYHVLENLLDWSRKESGKLVFVPEIFPMNMVVNEIVSNMQSLASLKGLTLLKHCEESAETVADLNMTRTILRNLISNAIKFSREGGCITILCKQRNLQVFVSVEDNGVGLSEHKISEILNSKSMLSTTGTSGEKGTGLGLQLCRDFIALHGGELKIESKPGEGSIFSFTVPGSSQADVVEHVDWLKTVHRQN